MITDKQGEAAITDLQKWATGISRLSGDNVEADVYYDADSNTYVFRLIKGSRVLVFRLSEAQVQTAGRENECERTLKRKIKDLSSLL